MISFASDYMEGAHEAILKRFLETAAEQLPGYGTDHYCKSAADKIKKACECPDAQIAFLTGGTQTNQLVIDAMLKPYEGVIAATTGHVNIHESGAVEYTGHKVLAIPHHDGKIRADELSSLLESFWNDENYEHMVFPGMVYISHPTELGTLYSRSELENIAGICRHYKIPLYMDGARLGYGLASNETDVDFAAIAKCCDIFYIGGTKAGALCGEAVVFTKNNMPAHFTTIIKQHGALLAKGWVTGLQFDVLFTDGLYFQISRHAIEMANLLREGFRSMGYKFHVESPTNQQFIVLENSRMKDLLEKVNFGFWEKSDDSHSVVRFVTSWATKKENVDKLISLL